MNQPYESTLRINPTNQPYESTLRINPPYQGGQGGSNLKSIQPYESTLGINPTNQPPLSRGAGGIKPKIHSTLRINPTNQPPLSRGAGGIKPKIHSTLRINPPYQGGQGGSNLKSIFNLIITSYLGFTEKVFTGGRV